MKAFRYFTAVFAIAALASCNDDLAPGGYAGDPNAVRITATVGTPTRSNPVGDATSVKQFNNGDRISVSSSKQDAAVYEFNGTGWSPTIQDKYLTWNSNRQHFTAYYPDTYKGSGNVPQKQNTEELIAAADYMKYDGQLDKQQTVSFTMARQTARVIINSGFNWNDEYKKGATSTHKVDAIWVNCMGVSDIEPYRPDNYYALVNPGSADPDATFLTITVSPVDGQGAVVTHTVKGIPEFEAGYSYEYDITIGKSGVTISDVTVEDWSTGSILGGEGSADDDVKTYFEVKAPKENFTFVGGSKNYEVNSYIRKGDGTLVAVPWTAKFVRKLDDGTYEEIKQSEVDYPTWITSFTSNGIGDNTKDVCTVTVETVATTNNHYYALKNNTHVSDTYNLSNATGDEAVENTANCYIINASGTYSIPLVYGNAIKNGADNPSAYKSTATGVSVLENFVNHKNTPITSPYIAAHEGCTPDNAILVWQDADNLVSNIQFVDGGSPEVHRITFEVAQSSIKQGNAIIAIRDAENTILWSWHIWVTDYKPLQAASVMNSYDPTETQKDKKIWTPDNKNSYTLMGVPLGWCDAESAAGHEVLIQFTQTDTGNTQEVTIKQEPLAAGGNAPFYQWGRKDPMLPSNGLVNSLDDKTYYGNYPFVLNGIRGNRGVSIGTAIQNPHIMYSYSNDTQFVDWCNPTETAGEEKAYYLYNLWDTHNNINDRKNLTLATKTIYDPSPVGYVIPPSGALDGITYNGQNVMLESSADYNQVNSQFKSENEVKSIGGWLFYCKGMNNTIGSYDKSGGVMFFPATGRRIDDGELLVVGEAGTNWTTDTYRSSAGNADAFNLSSDLKALIPENGLNKFYGVTVRPVRE